MYLDAYIIDGQEIKQWLNISITFLLCWWIRPYLSWFPFDFCWLWRRVSALVQMEFFGKYFVFKVRIFIKILKDKIHICKNYGRSASLEISKKWQYLQNLFCNLTWCLQTLSLPLGSDNEVPPHLPLPVEQILRKYTTLHIYQAILTQGFFLIEYQASNRKTGSKNNSMLTLWMVNKCGDPEVGDFGDQFWPLLKERLA